MKNKAAAPVHVRLLGAPGTGKTQLAAELASALAGGHGAPAVTIDDNPELLSDQSNVSVYATLLMGLDLPVPPALADMQQSADRALRNTLAQSGIAYQVVYGQGDQRLRSALSALQGAMAVKEDAGGARWVWACDNCSDPQCERRLLSDLLANRSAAR